MTRFTTHAVENQTPPLEDLDLFTTDLAMADGVAREGAEWALGELSALGTTVGGAEFLDHGRLANLHPPTLKAADRWGRRVEQVEFHPSWHALMHTSVAAGVHTAPWAEPKPGAHVARAAAGMIMVQVEAGHQCPITMTYGCIPALKHAPELAKTWLPKLYSRSYDPSHQPVELKSGALIGMGMTEKQGGSDVRANSSVATPVGARGTGEPYLLVGHKWFFSAPQLDAWLVLARTEGRLSCFFLPKFRPDGELNAIRIQRLKDKVGNRSNASSEVEFHDALGFLVGEEGRGVPVIIEMANHTRLDCALGTTGLMRRGLAEAVHHARHRRAFGARLIEHPAMRNVLADLTVEYEAAIALVLRLARAYDAQDDPAEKAIRRLLTPAAKYLICKLGAGFGQECMEVLGGNGYVEDFPLARIYREMPLNSIWEGSGNVMCLDVLRAVAREPDAVSHLMRSLERGMDSRLDAAIADVEAALMDPTDAQWRARSVVEQLVRCVQGSLLLQGAPAPTARAFLASRIGGGGRAYGQLPASADADAIIARALPEA